MPDQDSGSRLSGGARRKQDVLDRAHGLGRRLPRGGFEDADTRRLVDALEYLRAAGLPTTRPLLPQFLQLKGQPYTLRDHFHFEPFFRLRMPPEMMLLCGRQIGKSTVQAAEGIMKTAAIPYFNLLYVAPLFEMIRRFSHQYVRDFLDNSPVKRLLTGKRTMNSVLQRTFLNGSSMYFSYAFLDAERTRGIPGDGVGIDEIQYLNYDFLPVIFECLSGSPWGIKRFSGTPSSLDNCAARLWQDTSQAEWAIKCLRGGCGRWNFPHVDHDLLDMIGPYRADISEDEPGVVCVQCGKPLAPRGGRWVHAYPERRWSFPGYHVPQTVVPMHYADPQKWELLVAKRDGRVASMSQSTFLNEVCGVACDEGAKLVTETDLKRAAVLPWPNRAAAAERHLKRYRFRVLAVDWGGGGGILAEAKKRGGSARRARTSYTTLAAMGLTADDKVEVFWGHRSKRTNDYEYEATLCLEALGRLRCSHLVHDFGGAGAAREAFIRQAGFPYEQIVPVKYGGPALGKFWSYKEPCEDQRGWWQADKSYTLAVTCSAIKLLLIKFFQYDYVSADQPGLLSDFLALVEEKVEARIGTDVFVVSRNPNLPDDFAQAVNIGSCALWHMGNCWPDLAAAAHMKMSASTLKKVHPPESIDWKDI